MKYRKNCKRKINCKRENTMLERIHNYDDFKKLNTDELECLASEVRDFLIENVSKTGGHLAANLGVAELTIALLKEFDPYYDRIVWDVGHQAYVYKILTGRADRFETLRKYGGLSGFPKVSESDADAFNSGHSSTSVSAAAGFAAAARLKGTGEKAVAVIGDGAMTGGMAFEALNHAGSMKLPMIVILNDNGMSISQNVGGIAKRLKHLRSTARYTKIKTDVKSALDRIPVVGKPLKDEISKIKRNVRNVILPGGIFEDFGFKYIGPVDGHNISELRAVFRAASEEKSPVLIHVHTKKGKGYTPAEKNPDLFHGVSSFDEKTGKLMRKKKEDWSAYFGARLCEIAETNTKVAAVTAAMPIGTGLREFSRRFPDRFFDVGIAEQHAVTFSAGMAKSGLIPVTAIYSTFLQRAYDQLIHDVALMNLHMVFCIDRCGPVGEDGETHQGVFDIAYISHIPNMILLSPSNKGDFSMMLSYAVNRAEGPVAIRYPRGEAAERETLNVSPLKSELVRDGNDALILAVGITLYDVIEAARILETRGISVAVADVRCVKPIDIDFVKENMNGKKLIVSVEDGVEIGGFGQMLESAIGKQVLKFAYPNEPIVQGSVDELKKKYNMSADAIADGISAEFTALAE